MSQKTIECKAINKRFKQGDLEIQPLKAIDFDANENELIMLTGPSGSGKTTLLSIIGGILQQDSGDCVVLDKRIYDLSESERTLFRGKNIGFIFQTFNLVPTLDVIENAALPLLINGTERNKALAEGKKILESMNLSHQLYRNPKDISGGEQQRVAIARACIHKPRIILCDEPTSFLDYERGKQIMELLQKIKNDTKCTLIIVTHDPRVLSFADRILEIDNGIMKSTDGTSEKV